MYIAGPLFECTVFTKKQIKIKGIVEFAMETFVLLCHEPQNPLTTNDHHDMEMVITTRVYKCYHSRPKIH
jgi:hypothetical protein